MNLQELRDQKGRLAEEAKQILNAQTTPDMRKEDETKFDAIHSDIEKLTKTIQRLERQDEIEKSLAEPQHGGRRSEHNETTERRESRPLAGGKITETDRVEAFRTWALAGTGTDISTERADHARRCGLPVDAKRIMLNFGPTIKPTHFRDGNLRVQAEDLRVWQREVDEKRAALTGAQSTTTTGGYTTADAAMRALEVALLAFGGMRTVATVLRTDTGGPLPIPTTNDTSNKGEIIGEGSSNNELENTFGQLVLDAWKYSSKYILASVEFLQDSSINVAEFIGTALANRIGRIQNDHFTTGSGSQPNGIVTAATSSAVTGSGVASVSYDNIVDLIHTIDPAYRNNGRFMFHDGGLKMLKKVKVLQYSGDTTGYPLWTPGLAVGQPDLIAGYPYIINQSMTTPATGVKSILFGDFSKYIIRDVSQIELRRLDERFAELGQVAFLAFARTDGDLLDAGTHPVKYLTQA